MSEKADRARLDFILKMILDIEKILVRHDDISAALEDFEGQHAILMCLMQIGEKLNKINLEKFRILLPVQEAYALRNIITHNYDAINLSIIEEIVSSDLPKIKAIIEGILK